jgi:nicotinamidase-related amidase
MNIQLLVIDPQNDFMDIPNAALPVTGANEDMIRLAGLVDRVGNKLQKIHVTMDSHHLVDIAHPAFWRDSAGNSPDPMTIISAESIKDGTWTPRRPELRNYAIGYAEQLESDGKYQVMVWPPHCLIGSWGHNVQSDLAAALDRWSAARIRNIDFVTKGTNVLTEHYGALLAEVPIANDPSTQLNGRFLAMLQEADVIAVAGEASSHCVKATVEQVADNIGEEHVKKFQLLTDCMSPVPAIVAQDGAMIVDFPGIADQFLKDMESRGMKLTNSVDFFS